MSPYSWIAAERIGGVLPQASWRPVLLLALFKEHKRTSWGLTDAREQSMAECEARAAARGLGAIRWPERWPTSDLLIARAMAYADMRGELQRFALCAMRLAFREGGDLAERDVVLEAARRAGLDPSDTDRALEDQAVKQALRDTTGDALAAGVFGVPSVVLGGEVFWGDDRLEDAARAFAAANGD
jgi:2-hydroxychromene-2-carboxylate isomerase